LELGVRARLRDQRRRLRDAPRAPLLVDAHCLEQHHEPRLGGRVRRRLERGGPATARGLQAHLRGEHALGDHRSGQCGCTLADRDAVPEARPVTQLRRLRGHPGRRVLARLAGRVPLLEQHGQRLRERTEQLWRRAGREEQRRHRFLERSVELGVRARGDERKVVVPQARGAVCRQPVLLSRGGEVD